MEGWCAEGLFSLHMIIMITLFAVNEFIHAFLNKHQRKEIKFQ